MPDKDVEAIVAEPPTIIPPAQDAEVDVGVDLTGDRVPDLWLKFRGRWELIAALLAALAVGIMLGRYIS